MKPEAENRNEQQSVLDLVLPALERAAQKAREEALAHSTDLIVWQTIRCAEFLQRKFANKLPNTL